jgi:hypothetical protein
VTVRPPRTAREFRQFVTQHHPDRGGDPAVFSAGVAAWRAVQVDGPPVVFYRKGSRRRRAVSRARRALPRALPPALRGRLTTRRVR